VTFFHLLIDNVNVGHSGDNLVFNNRLDLERGMKTTIKNISQHFKFHVCFGILAFGILLMMVLVNRI
jgi:hypothetical protein